MKKKTLPIAVGVFISLIRPALAEKADPMADWLDDPSVLLEVSDEELDLDETEGKTPKVAKTVEPIKGMEAEVSELPPQLAAAKETPKDVQLMSLDPVKPGDPKSVSPSVLLPPVVTAKAAPGVTPNAAPNTLIEKAEKPERPSVIPSLAGAGIVPIAPMPTPVRKEELAEIEPKVVQRVPGSSVAPMPLQGVSDISVILSNNQFFPAKVRLKEGSSVRLIFTTTNRKPAALVIEKLNIQRWIAKDQEAPTETPVERAKWEVHRELSASRVTEVLFEGKPGTYGFYDAMSGASGEIVVE